MHHNADGGGAADGVRTGIFHVSAALVVQTAYFSVLYHCLLQCSIPLLLLQSSMFYATAYFSVLCHCLLQCSIPLLILQCSVPLLTSVFYTKVDSEAKTCTSIENVYGLEQCINGHYNWNTLPWVFAFFSVAEMRLSATLIWIFVILPKRETWTRTRGARSESIGYTAQNACVPEQTGMTSTLGMKPINKGNPCKHGLSIYALESTPSHDYSSVSLILGKFRLS
jgi:hypothetical protein